MGGQFSFDARNEGWMLMDRQCLGQALYLDVACVALLVTQRFIKK
jgi:hypothetical protein